MDIIQQIEREIAPVDRKVDFEIGDTVKVHYRIVEGTRERIQVFEGIVIAIDNKGLNKNFTVRKLSFDVGVERIFPLLSTLIAKIEVVRKGKARRSKLYYLRERKGKSAKLREKNVKTVKKKHTVRVEDIPSTGTAPEETAEETIPGQES
ncbi:MAG: 50S ribosomal protein L19 [Chrysiogenales bacterium]|nr:MAG: 50S ribosomal protein L19 [Chrysiogenales bacterium]